MSRALKRTEAQPLEAGSRIERRDRRAIDRLLRPSEAALWQLIESHFAEALRHAKPDRRSLKLATAALENLQALYLLLDYGGFDLTRLRARFALAHERLRPLLHKFDNRWVQGDIDEYHDLQHRARVWQSAREFAATVDKDQPSRPDWRRLDREDVRRMGGFFQEVVSLQNSHSVFLEPAFARQMLADWDKPLITTTAHAVETLHELARLRAGRGRRRSQSGAPDGFRVEPEVLTFVDSLYSDGQFADPPGDYHGPAQDLYATSSGIAIFKAARDIACNEQPTERVLPSLFDLPDGQSDRARYGIIRERALSRLKEMLGAAGASGEAAKIVEINHALRILWNLSADVPGGVATLIEDCRGRLIDYLRGCLRNPAHPRGLRPLVAFSMTPALDAPCVTACLAALRIMDAIGLPSTDELWRAMASCQDYVLACEAVTGGFGSSIDHEPDTLHTYMAITLLTRWHSPALDSSMSDHVIRFLETCADEGGYALLPDWKATAYGCRLALQIYKRLERELPDSAAMQSFIRGLMSEGVPSGYAGLPHRDSEIVPAL